jgi:hypothetical protein
MCRLWRGLLLCSLPSVRCSAPALRSTLRARVASRRARSPGARLAAARAEQPPMSQPSWVAGRLQPEPAYSRFLYNLIFKRSSTYMTAVPTAAAAPHRCRGPPPSIRAAEPPPRRRPRRRHLLRPRAQLVLGVQEPRGARHERARSVAPAAARPRAGTAPPAPTSRAAPSAVDCAEAVEGHQAEL